MTENKVGELKEVNEELLAKLKEEINNMEWDEESNPIEDYNSFSFFNEKFAFIMIGKDNWEDDGTGKYQFNTEEWQLASFDDKELPYPCEKNIIDNYNIKINIPVSRTGSYYDDFYYNYEHPYFSKAIIKEIPEVIIPAHTEIEYVEVD